MNLISLSWWFDRGPNQDPTTLKIYFIAFLAMIIVGAVVRMLSKRRLKDRFALEIARRTATLMVTMGVLGIGYWFFAFERIPFLSSRFWLIVWLITGLIWLHSILKFAYKKVPKERERLNQRKDQRKYFEKK